MENWGVTETGFYAPTFVELQEELGIKLRAHIHPDLDLSDETILGQHNGITNRGRALQWEALRVGYNSYDVDAAEGVLFENLAKLTGIGLNPSRPSIVTLTCIFSSEDTIEPDVTFIARDDREDIRFTPIESGTYAAGSHEIEFRSENDGEVSAPSGTLTVISSGPSGLSSVTNAADATLGADAETIEQLRVRRDEEIAIAGGSTADAIKADLLNLEDAAGDNWILSVTMLNNYTSLVDVNGLPPHSFEAIIWTGGTPTGNQLNEIAQCIFDTAPDGIETFGGTSGTALDAAGDAMTINFTIAEEVEIHVEAELTVTVGPYAGDSPTKEAWANQMNSVHEPGETVVALLVRSFPLTRDGITDVPVFAIDDAPAPSADANLPVTVRQIARFDTSRITITITP